MAEIENSTLAIIPLRKKPRFKIIFKDDWHIESESIWANKTVERHFFRLEPEEDEIRWFECNRKLAKNIIDNIYVFIAKNKIDKEKLKGLEILIRTKDGNNISEMCENINYPKIGRFTRVLKWLKNL